VFFRGRIKEEKDTPSVGQAQVRSKLSVPRQPAFAVAAYSALHLAALLTFGPGRDEHYQPLLKWRRNADRLPPRSADAAEEGNG
jgi:hypothetical protein